MPASVYASTTRARRLSNLRFASALGYDSKKTFYHEKKAVDQIHELNVMMAESGLESPEHKKPYRIFHLDDKHRTVVSEEWTFLLRFARINLARKTRRAGNELVGEGLHSPHLAVA